MWLACAACEHEVALHSPPSDTTSTLDSGNGVLLLTLPVAQRPPKQLQLALTDIRGAAPSSPFSIAVEALWREQRASLGDVTPYPANRPGRFALRVPSALAAAAVTEHVTIRLTWRALSKDQPAPAVSVQIATPSWRY